MQNQQILQEMRDTKFHQKSNSISSNAFMSAQNSYYRKSPIHNRSYSNSYSVTEDGMYMSQKSSFPQSVMKESYNMVNHFYQNLLALCYLKVNCLIYKFKVFKTGPIH